MAIVEGTARVAGMELAEPGELGLDADRLERLSALITRHVADGRYPGAQAAIARNGKLAWFKTYGRAATQPAAAAADDTLWLLFSQTKVVTAAATWALVDRGVLRFHDRVADHIPEFARNGKADITLFDVLTHQGGFPNATVPAEAWTDHDVLRRTVADFSLEWTPRSKVHYHGTSAHWVTAAVIEAATARDFRDVIRTELIDPLGLGGDLHVGVAPEYQSRCVDMHAPADGALVPRSEQNSAAWRAAGVPGAGGYATAAALAAFYQMLLRGGEWNGRRILSPAVIRYATRNQTGDAVDGNFGMPMHRGIGPHVRGTTPTIRGLGTIASPSTFGHGGAGSSYSWADPESGVSFSYLTNARLDEPWHSVRLDQISNLAHAAIVGPGRDG